MTHRSGKRDPSLSASTLFLSLFLPLSPTIDRSIPLGGIVIPHFRSCTRKFPLHQTSPDSWNSCPHGHRTTNIEYTASERSFSLSRGISSYSNRVENGDIFPPKFPSPGIYRRDLDKLGTWTLCLERGFRNWPRANALLIAVHVGLKYSIGEGERRLFGHRSRAEFSKRESSWIHSLPPPHLTGLNIKLNSRNENILFLGYNQEPRPRISIWISWKILSPSILPRYLRCFPCKSNSNLWQPWRITVGSSDFPT